jgi:serine/threonine protein kinase
MSDNSYKLFASAPPPGQLTGDGPTHRNSAPYAHSSDLPDSSRYTDQRFSSDPQLGTRVASEESTEGSGSGHHHHHRHHARPAASSDNVTSPESVPPATEKSIPDSLNQQQPVIKGPWRLLRLLPRESRNIVGSMLEIDPRKRATLEDILSDPWISSTPVCRQEDGGLLVFAEEHAHTLEPSAGVGASETQRSSKK